MIGRSRARRPALEFADVGVPDEPLLVVDDVLAACPFAEPPLPRASGLEALEALDASGANAQ